MSTGHPGSTGTAIPGPSSIHPIAALRGPDNVGTRAPVASVSVPHPLPDVPTHVDQPIAIGPLLPDRVWMQTAVGHEPAENSQLVTTGKECVLPTPPEHFKKMLGSKADKEDLTRIFELKVNKIDFENVLDIQ